MGRNICAILWESCENLILSDPLLDALTSILYPMGEGQEGGLLCVMSG